MDTDIASRSLVPRENRRDTAIGHPASRSTAVLYTYLYSELQTRVPPPATTPAARAQRGAAAGGGLAGGEAHSLAMGLFFPVSLTPRVAYSITGFPTACSRPHV